MLKKLTEKGKVLPKEMALLFGGTDCTDQCIRDCDDDPIVRKGQNGDDCKGGLPI